MSNDPREQPSRLKKAPKNYKEDEDIESSDGIVLEHRKREIKSDEKNLVK